MEEQILFKRKFGFEVWEEEKIKKAFEFAEGYKKFLSECKTEREVVNWVLGKVKGSFQELESIGEKKHSDSQEFYLVNRRKSVVLARLGQRPIREGLRIILAHIDSPRIDLKLMPLYEEEKIAWLKTQYYGGIKKYQWPAIPLALHGEVVLEDGKKVSLRIGEGKDDPVFTITDLLPHLSGKQMEKKLEEAIEGEEMNIIVGSWPVKEGETKEKEKVKFGVLKKLFQNYGIREEDLVSADLEIVPAGEARDLGFDRSLVGGYGQDDRICAYAAVQAFLTLEEGKMPCLLVLVDKEETGSESNTGALSNFIPDFISELLYLEEKKHDENLLRDCLSCSKAISADVTVGFDPDYKDAFDARNTARLGAGIVLEKYTGRRGKSGTSEATAEFMAEIRRLFNKKGILWQTGGLGKVDLGGGGTIAAFLARYNLDVVDAGPPVLSMHSPFEVSSKIDLYACYEAYRVFFEG